MPIASKAKECGALIHKPFDEADHAAALEQWRRIGNSGYQSPYIGFELGFVDLVGPPSALASIAFSAAWLAKLVDRGLKRIGIPAAWRKSFIMGVQGITLGLLLSGQELTDVVSLLIPIVVLLGVQWTAQNERAQAFAVGATAMLGVLAAEPALGEEMLPYHNQWLTGTAGALGAAAGVLAPSPF